MAKRTGRPVLFLREKVLTLLIDSDILYRELEKTNLFVEAMMQGRFFRDNG